MTYRGTRDYLADLRHAPPTLAIDQFDEAGFKYIGDGNYAIEIDGHCYLIFTDSQPGRGVIRDGVRLTLRFVEGATAEEIRETLEELEANRC